MVVKELYPLSRAVRRFAPTWRNMLVKVGTDNTGVILGLNAGRLHTPAARAMMIEIADLQDEYHFDLFAQWVPRELNVVADKLSRQIAYAAAMETAYPSRHAVPQAAPSK